MQKRKKVQNLNSLKSGPRNKTKKKFPAAERLFSQDVKLLFIANFLPILLSIKILLKFLSV